MRASYDSLGQCAANCISKIVAISLGVALSGCVAQDADIANLPVSDFARNAAYPALLDQHSIDATLAGLPADAEDNSSLEARAEALRARADRLARRKVLTAAERAQMQDALASAN